MGQVHPLRRHLSILISELNPIHFLNKPMGEPVPLLRRPTLRLSFGGRHLHCYQVPGHGLTFSDIVLPGILELHPNIVQIIIRYSSDHISRHVFTADELRILFQCGIRRIGVAVRHGSCSHFESLDVVDKIHDVLTGSKQLVPEHHVGHPRLIVHQHPSAILAEVHPAPLGIASDVPLLFVWQSQSPRLSDYRILRFWLARPPPTPHQPIFLVVILHFHLN